MKRSTKGILIALSGILIIFGAIIAMNKIYRNWFFNLVAIIGGLFTAIGIMIVYFSYRDRKKDILYKTLDEIDDMEGREFEDYLCRLFTKLNFTVRNTKHSRDFGADLILTDNERKIVVQAKRYRKKVPIDAVQECAASRLHYKADEAWLVTNNYFTQAAQELALTNSVRLISRNELASMIKQIQKQSS